MESRKLLLVAIFVFLSDQVLVLSLPHGCHWNTPVYLKCVNAGLEMVPDDIPQSTIYIDLSENPSLKFPNDYFLRFMKLQMLDLDQCRLKGPISLPKSLRLLYIKKNLFSEEAIQKTFENATLYYIDISYNNLNLEHVLKVLPKTVTALVIEGNLMPVVRKDYFREFRKLRSLNAYNCGINKIERNSFDSLLQLHELILGFNNLKVIPDKLFQCLRKLRVLGLNHNQFFKPPVIQGPIRMMNLFLHENKIERLKPMDLYHLQVGRLILYGNQIRSFDLPNTKYLVIDLSFNRIERLHAFAFKGRRTLSDIKLQNNNFSYISPLAFRGLTQIGSLHLQRNNISSLSKAIFKDMIMEHLFLYGNNISSMYEVFIVFPVYPYNPPSWHAPLG